MTDLAQRIRERLSAVRKSAAAASIEAGLGRSAVQDILSGNSASPRLDTLEKLKVPLQCSIAYLVGGGEVINEQSKFWEDLTLEAVQEVAESGVFKRAPRFGERAKPSNEREYAHVRDVRLPKSRIKLYRLNDNSLDLRGIHVGDILHVAETDEHIRLEQGQVVLARHTLHPVGLSELVVRAVHEETEGFLLVPDSSSEFDAFSIAGASMGLENSYSLEGGYLSIEGIVVGLYRELPIGQ